jgi:uncharacterized protein (DUF1015 family)
MENEDTLEINWLQNIFEKTESLYIADGHHRTEALKLLSEENKLKIKQQIIFLVI